MQQRNKTISVRIVLYCRYLRRDIVFISLKIDYAVNFPRTTTSETSRSNTIMVSSAALFNTLTKRLLRLIGGQLGIIIYRAVSTTGTCWFINSNTHNPYLVFRTNLYDSQDSETQWLFSNSKSPQKPCPCGAVCLYGWLS